MKCSDIQNLIPLYLTGEIDSRSLAEFEQHLEGCTACRLSVEQEQGLDKSIRSAFFSESVDAAPLRLRVLDEIDSLQRPKSRAHWLRLPVVGAGIAAALVGVAFLATGVAENKLYKDASIDHVNEVVLRQPRQWATGESGIAEYLAKHLGVIDPVHQLNVPGYRLIRTKECELSDTRYVHLVFDNGSQEMSMYLLAPEEHPLLSRIATSLLPSIRSHSESGYNVTEGDYRGRRVLLVSRLSQGEEQTIVEHFVHSFG